MKAAQINQYGDINVIEINKNAKMPKPSPGKILIEVYATGINPVETAFREGHMKEKVPLTFPWNLGGDYSGIIIQTNESIPNFRVGDSVYGISNPFKNGTGSVAEFVVADIKYCGHKPSSIDHIQAASLPLTGTSALQGIEEHINLQPNQKILIQGGVGGIGSLAIQIAKNIGAYVATTVSTEDIEFAKKLGADEVIDYKNQDFTNIIKDYNSVFDTVGGEITNKSMNVIKQGGILVTMAGNPDMNLAQEKGISAIRQMTRGDTAQLTRLKELVDGEKLKPIVQNTFPIEQTKEAYIELGKHPKGKIVIKIK